MTNWNRTSPLSQRKILQKLAPTNPSTSSSLSTTRPFKLVSSKCWNISFNSILDFKILTARNIQLKIELKYQINFSIRNWMRKKSMWQFNSKMSWTPTFSQIPVLNQFINHKDFSVDFFCLGFVFDRLWYLSEKRGYKVLIILLPQPKLRIILVMIRLHWNIFFFLHNFHMFTSQQVIITNSSIYWIYIIVNHFTDPSCF